MPAHALGIPYRGPNASDRHPSAGARLQREDGRSGGGSPPTGDDSPPRSGQCVVAATAAGTSGGAACGFTFTRRRTVSAVDSTGVTVTVKLPSPVACSTAGGVAPHDHNAVI